MTFDEIINKSISDNCKIEITYRSYNQENTTRELSNEEFSDEFQKFHRSSYHYISAYCHLRNEKRTFKLNRIKKVRLVGSPYNSEWVMNPYYSSRRKSSSTGCYIATMVYGNYEHPKVVTLRTFRDDVILKYFLGKLFVKSYYYISPGIVYILKNQNTINKVIRRFLDKLIDHLIKFQ